LPEREPEQLASMPFMQHLAELRQVLIVALVILCVGTLAAWFFSARILSVLTELLPDDSPAHVFSPAETFLIRLKVSAATALFLGVPIILYKIWGFVAPGLYRHEKSKLRPLFLTSTVLFYTGTVFAYMIIIPITLGYFYRLKPENVTMTIGISELFSMVAKLSVAFGVVFQLPLIVLLLSLMGLVTPGWLLKQWRVALIVLLTFSAIMTPPDLISQLAMAVPVFVLYLVSALIALILGRRKRLPGSVDSPPDL